MKRIALILIALFVIGCDFLGMDDSIPPLKQNIVCIFKETTVESNITFSMECLQRKEKVEWFFLENTKDFNIKEDDYDGALSKDDILVLPKEAIKNNGKDFSCNIGYFPYKPHGTDRSAQRNPKEETELTCTFRIHKDGKLLYEKVFEYPQEDSSSITVNL